MKFYRGFQSEITCLSIVSNSSLVVHKAKTVWSWTGSCNFDSYNPCMITSEGISLASSRVWSHRSLGRRHSSNFFWTNLRVLVLLQKLRLHGNDRGSCKQFVFLSRIGRIFEHAALRHLLFCGSGCACREVLPLQCRSNHRIKHIVVGEIVSPHNRSLCHKFVNWGCYLNFFDPVHCEMTTCWFRTYVSLEVDFLAFGFPWSQEFFPDAIPRLEIS